MELDLVIRNGNVVNATEEVFCDIGIAGGKIVALSRKLEGGSREIDADGNYVFPGGIDSHCHIEQLSSSGLMCADDFYSGTVSAAFGGTTTIVPFAAQHRGDSLRKVVSDYHALARPKAVVDYAFHMIISDPTDEVMREELPGAHPERLHLVQGLHDLRAPEARRLPDARGPRPSRKKEGALTMVHAENHDMIRWLTERLLLQRAGERPSSTR